MKPGSFRAVAMLALGLLAFPVASYAAGSSSDAPAQQADLYKQART